MLAAPALAQAPLDGKAVAGGPVGDALRKAVTSPGIAAEEMRQVMRAMIARQIPADDKDLLAELAAGAAVEVMVDGPPVHVPALAPDVLAIAKIMSVPPNHNTLWKQRGEPTLQLIEMSRWGDTAKNRVTGFMANKLYAEWAKSSVNNAYSQWVQEYAGVTNAIIEIADPAVKTEAKLLLKSAMEQVFAKCKADARVTPPYFLYSLPLESVGVPSP
jgi:hypothetical protein